jgi:hypothetical protein
MDFDKGAAKKFVLDRHRVVSKNRVLIPQFDRMRSLLDSLAKH